MTFDHLVYCICLEDITCILKLSFFFIETEDVILTLIFFSTVVPCQNLLSFVLPLPRK